MPVTIITFNPYSNPKNEVILLFSFYVRGTRGPRTQEVAQGIRELQKLHVEPQNLGRVALANEEHWRAGEWQ